MKRLILILMASAAVAGCESQVIPAGKSDAVDPEGWVQAPVVTGVARQPPAIEFTGVAAPGVRVALRGPGDSTYAASANDKGRFEIRLIPPAGASLFSLQTQDGQAAIPAPDRLLVIDGGRGPIAALRAGAASRRLDAGGAGLWAIDSDGQTTLASGLARTAGETVVISEAGQALRAQAGADRRWMVRLGSAQGVQFAGHAYAWPGHATGAGFGAARAGEGWRVIWGGDGGARQSTWLPDAVARP